MPENKNYHTIYENFRKIPLSIDFSSQFDINSLASEGSLVCEPPINSFLNKLGKIFMKKIEKCSKILQEIAKFSLKISKNCLKFSLIFWKI